MPELVKLYDYIKQDYSLRWVIVTNEGDKICDVYTDGAEGELINLGDPRVMYTITWPDGTSQIGPWYYVNNRILAALEEL